MRSKIALLMVAVLATGLGGCLGDDAGPIVVSGDWLRTSPASAENGAAYMIITSDVDDALTGASVDPSVASAAEVHETIAVESGDDATDDDSMEGMEAMTMQQVESIDLPAGEPVALEPGGYHIMLLGLTEPLESGALVEITLSFASGTELVVPVAVRDDAP